MYRSVMGGIGCQQCASDGRDWLSAMCKCRLERPPFRFQNNAGDQIINVVCISYCTAVLSHHRQNTVHVFLKQLVFHSDVVHAQRGVNPRHAAAACVLLQFQKHFVANLCASFRCVSFFVPTRNRTADNGSSFAFRALCAHGGNLWFDAVPHLIMKTCRQKEFRSSTVRPLSRNLKTNPIVSCTKVFRDVTHNHAAMDEEGSSLQCTCTHWHNRWQAQVIVTCDTCDW
jgi:hypothetical protein